MNLTVTVQPTDIEAGEPDDQTSCPIALALKRELDLPDDRVFVDTQFALVDGAYYRLDAYSQAWIREFDMLKSTDDGDGLCFEDSEINPNRAFTASLEKVDEAAVPGNVLAGFNARMPPTPIDRKIF